MEEEEWRQHPYVATLRVSSWGRLKGVRGHVLCVWVRPDGRESISRNHLGQHKTFLVHVLVCETFHGPKPDGKQVAHGDSNPRNNQSANLRWATPVENNSDKYARNTTLQGTKHPLSKLTDDQVLEIRRRVKLGEMQYLLAREFGVTNMVISNVKLRKSWKHIPEEEDQ